MNTTEKRILNSIPPFKRIAASTVTVVLSEGNDAEAETWIVELLDTGLVLLVNKKQKKAISVGTNGALQLREPDGGDATQQWFINPMNPKSFALRQSGSTLAVSGGHVVIEPFDNTAPQRQLFAIEST
jgi:hypothetical protein